MRGAFLVIGLAACGGGGGIGGPKVPASLDLGHVPLDLPTVFRVEIDAGASPVEVVSTRFEPADTAFYSPPGAVVAGYPEITELVADFAEVSDGKRTIEAGTTYGWPFVVGPRAPGAIATTLSLVLDDGDALTVDLAAEAPAPDLAAPTALDLGTVAIGVTASRDLALENRGDVPLALVASFEGDVFHTPEPTPFVLGAGKAGVFEVAVQPTTTDPATGTLTLSVGDVAVATVDLTVNFPKP